MKLSVVDDSTTRWREEVIARGGRQSSLVARPRLHDGIFKSGQWQAESGNECEMKPEGHLFIIGAITHYGT